MAVNSIRISISAGSLILAALSVLLLPIRWIAAMLLCAVVHEVSHILVMLALRVRIDEIRIGCAGARICSEPMTLRQELLSAVAGPAGGICLLFFARSTPEIALCALFQTVYNLLPVYPSDGGRIAFCLIRRCTPAWETRLYKGLHWLTVFVVLLACLYAAVFLGFVMLPLAVAVILLVKNAEKNSLQRGSYRSTIVLPKK